MKQAALLLLFFGLIFPAPAQDSLLQQTKGTDTAITIRNAPVAVLQEVLKDNFLLNHQKPAVALPVQVYHTQGPESMFYLMLLLTGLLAFLKFFYARYFHTLFRVFFNTTLRQSQLTDQLMQAKLASLFYNLLFCFSGGMFLFLLLKSPERLAYLNPALLFMICTLGIASVYGVKYLALKFTGWITGIRTTTDTYIFIIFLVNKIMGILLMPLLVIMAFTDNPLKEYGRYAAFFIIGLLLIIRFVRAFGLLHNKIKVSRLHFLLYIAGVEIIPMLAVCKLLFTFLDKNL